MWPDWLTFRPIQRWPGTLTVERKRSMFSAPFSSTVDLLWRELGDLDAVDVMLQVALTSKDLRQDGKPRASARPEHPGVIIAFTMRSGSPLFSSHSEARDFLRSASGIPSLGQTYDVYFKAAAKIHHPDAGGEHYTFLRVQEAHRMLTSRDPFQFSVDKFTTWHDNLRAIALGLEALRKVERYGMGQGREQYTGWKQLSA